MCCHFKMFLHRLFIDQPLLVTLVCLSDSAENSRWTEEEMDKAKKGMEISAELVNIREFLTSCQVHATQVRAFASLAITISF